MHGYQLINNCKDKLLRDIPDWHELMVEKQLINFNAREDIYSQIFNTFVM